MELQWPLILFTTFLAWSAGVFGTQAIAALKGKFKKAQLPALITSFVLLVIGGIAVFFHLEHWERIFNGFGNITSGITQELIAIVVIVVIMVVYFIFIKKDDSDNIEQPQVVEVSDETKTVDENGETKTAETEKVTVEAKPEDKAYFPTWLAVIAIIIAVVLDIVMSHSYMMAARPAWNNIFEIFSIIGASCVLGPLTFAIIAKSATSIEAKESLVSTSFVGSIINAATTIVYIVSIALSASAFTNVGYYFDPTHPTYGMVEPANLASGASLAVTICAIVLCLIPVILTAIIRKKPAGNWLVFIVVSLIAAVAATVLLRVLMYQMGLTVFAFY